MHLPANDVTLASKSNHDLDVLLERFVVQAAQALNDPALHTTAETLDMLSTASQLAATVIEQRQMLDQLAHLAQHDPLTGVPNRILFEDRLEQALAHAHRTEHQVALLFIDLDSFKNVNDVYGHDAGDCLLKDVASRLAGLVRESDTVARLGGDEFAIILADTCGVSGAIRVAEDLLLALNSGCRVCGATIPIGCSIGISIYPGDGSTAWSLVNNADAAMYVAKRNGKNAYHLYSVNVDIDSTEQSTDLIH